MSRLNTMYPDDEFLKNISDMMGKLDNKNETEIKQEIEQIGYKEFYRYYKEKNVYIKQLQQENKQLKEELNKYKKIVEEINQEMEWAKDLVDTCELVDTNAITIYKIIQKYEKSDSNE